jgi:biotin carboxyl carrier protein
MAAKAWAWALALLLMACGERAPLSLQAMVPTPTPPMVLPSPTWTPTITTMGPVRQGAAFLLALHPAPPEPLTVSLASATYPMSLEGGAAIAYIPVPPDLPAGSYEVVVEAGGHSLARTTVDVAPHPFLQEEIWLAPQEASLLLDAQAIREEAEALARAYALSLPVRAWWGPWALPLDGEVSDPFGTLRSFNGGPYSRHTGVDIAAPAGTPVVAPSAGRVVLARHLHLRGLSVVIDHGAGVFTGYHHLGAILVQEGQWVSRGQQIGQVGDTGLASGPHLHWELVVHGQRVDPLAWVEGAPGP